YAFPYSRRNALDVHSFPTRRSSDLCVSESSGTVTSPRRCSSSRAWEPRIACSPPLTATYMSHLDARGSRQPCHPVSGDEEHVDAAWIEPSELAPFARQARPEPSRLESRFPWNPRPPQRPATVRAQHLDLNDHGRRAFRILLGAGRERREP